MNSDDYVVLVITSPFKSCMCVLMGQYVVVVGVYLTNPLEIVPESVILEQLTSDSVLLVRRQDVVGRFRDWCPLNEIIKQQDPRWRTMNVLGAYRYKDFLHIHCIHS